MSWMYLLAVLLLLPAVAVLVFGSCFVVATLRVRWKYRNIPSPKLDSFFLGHLPSYVKYTKNEGNYCDAYFEWYKTCGNLFVIFFMTSPLVVVLNPDDLKNVSRDQTVKQSLFIRNKLGYLLGMRYQKNSLLLIEDFDSWKTRRRMYDSAFRMSHLNKMLPAIVDCAEQVIDRMKQVSQRGVLREMLLREEMNSYTLQVIGKVAFGRDFTKEFINSRHVRGKWKFSELVSTAFTGIQCQMANSYYQYFHPWKSQDYREVARTLRTVGRDCIQERITAVKNGEEVPNDVLSTMLKIAIKEQDFTIEDLVDDFVGFYGDGNETMSNLLCFAVIEILQHQPVLSRLLTEIDTAVSNDKPITSEILEELVYMDQVLKETLRLYPAFPAFRRRVPQGYVLSGYEMPQDTEVVVPVYIASRLEVNFEDPLRFDPDRFDTSRESPNLYAYFPFGLGYRSCIGRHLAMIEAKVLLVKLLQAFTITLPNGYKPGVAVRSSIQPKDKIPVIVELRK